MSNTFLTSNSEVQETLKHVVEYQEDSLKATQGFQRSLEDLVKQTKPKSREGMITKTFLEPILSG
jgi:hypothetical protein